MLSFDVLVERPIGAWRARESFGSELLNQQQAIFAMMSARRLCTYCIDDCEVFLRNVNASAGGGKYPIKLDIHDLELDKKIKMDGARVRLSLPA